MVLSIIFLEDKHKFLLLFAIRNHHDIFSDQWFHIFPFHNEQFFFNGKLLVLIFRTWVLFVEGLQKKKVEHVRSQTAHIQYSCSTWYNLSYMYICVRLTWHNPSYRYCMCAVCELTCSTFFFWRPSTNRTQVLKIKTNSLEIKFNSNNDRTVHVLLVCDTKI
jgi:hypothetical protein